MRKLKDNKKRTKRKIAISGAVLVSLIFCLCFQFKNQYGPIIDEISKLKAKGLINEIINETMEMNFSSDKYDEKLFIMQKDKNEDIQMVQANTSLINSLVSNFSNNLQKRYNHQKNCELEIPLGTLIGSKIISQSRFNVKIKILPLSVSMCNYKTDFEEQGINQTKYRLFLIIKSEVRILQPFSSKNFKIENKVLMAETVIVGKVPNSYVVVPEEDILDVTEE